MKEKVIVGLSGGVDSGVVIIELLKAGYLVEAMFMRNWDSLANHDILGNPSIDDSLCPQETDYQDALKVATKLGVKLHRVDFVEEYWENVFKHFLSEYEKGRTPNPDILCNKEIKFKAFLSKAKKLGASYIAMGHYARVVHGEKTLLLRGLDDNKDQSYFLCQLNKEQLDATLFPIGHLKKQVVRKIAHDAGLEVASKKDSTGVCFIGERHFKAFLQNYLPAQPGLMKTMKGDIVGHHDGVMYYTIGQRKGLNIGGPGDAWFVVGKDVRQNILYVGQGKEQDLLFANRVLVSGLNIINERFFDGQNLMAKFRYRQKDVEVKVYWMGSDQLEVRTLSLVKAITPGQACVFYQGEVCLGGGTIDEVYLDDEKRPY